MPKLISALSDLEQENSFIIKNVHIITGNGTEPFDQNVYVSKGIIENISDEPIVIKGVQIIDGEGKTLVAGLIDSHVHIQGMNSRSDEDSDRFLSERIPQILAEGVFPYGVTRWFLCSAEDFVQAAER